MRRFVPTATILMTAIASCPRAPAQSPSAEAVTYDQVRPVFRKHCVTCHNQDRARGDLNLSTLDGIKAGSSSGVAVVAKKPDESPIFLLPAHLEDPKMPPNSPKIPQRELDLIRRWIEGGLQERPAVTSPSTASAKLAAPMATAPAPQTSTPEVNNVVVKVEPLARPAPITALAASPVAPLIAVSGRKQVVLMEWQSQNTLKAFAFPEGDVFDLRFSRDGNWLLAGGGMGGMSGKVVAFDVATGRRIFEIGDEADVVLALALSPDNSLVALGGPSRSIKVFRTANGEHVTTLRKHTDWILSLAYSPDGLLLASSDRFGNVQVWETQSGKEFHTLRGHGGPVHSLAWSADSDRLLSVGEDGTLRRWNMHDGSQEKQWNVAADGILAVASDMADKVVCGGRNGRITVYDKAGNAGQPLTMSDAVGELALTNDASHVVVGDVAGNITVHQLQSGELLARLQLPVAPSSQWTKLARPSSKKPSPSGVTKISDAQDEPSRIRSELSEAEAESRQAAADLAATRNAAVTAEAAVKAAETSLAQFREVAAKLQALVGPRELAAQQAALRVADARKRMELNTKAAQGDTASSEQDRELLNQRLEQRRSLYQAVTNLVEQIEAAAAQSPQDTSLHAAMKLAKELQSKLAGEATLATTELNRTQVSSAADKKAEDK